MPIERIQLIYDANKTRFPKCRQNGTFPMKMHQWFREIHRGILSTIKFDKHYGSVNALYGIEENAKSKRQQTRIWH